VISKIINKITAAIGKTKPIQSLLLPLGEFFTMRLADGNIMKNIATSKTAPAICNQSIRLFSKKSPCLQGLVFNV
jgi:hypothetical protein